MLNLIHRNREMNVIQEVIDPYLSSNVRTWSEFVKMFFWYFTLSNVIYHVFIK